MRIEIVKNLEQLKGVRKLHHDEFVREGLIEANPTGITDMFAPYELTRDGELRSGTDIAFVVGKHGDMIGTCSCSLDGADGIPMDASFPAAVSIERGMCAAANVALAASWRIISVPSNTKCVIASIFDWVAEWVDENEVYSLLTEFHPHHAKFYTRIGFETLATGTDVRVDAPASLMRTTISRAGNWEQQRHRFFCN